MRPTNRKSAIRTPHSAFRRFCGDESGQGILFAAATLLVLVGFIAFVFNIGRLLDRRTKTQIAADAAAYSGAMVEANSVSAIAWINSAMAQVYYNSLNYAKDVDVAAVAAELERRMNADGMPAGPAWSGYQTAYLNARTGLPQAKQWMVQLSELENAIAIVTPRLAEEEMFAVAGRAGGERMSVYPSFRMFPSPDSQISYSITCLGNGWQVVNLITGDTLLVQLMNNGNTWDFQWTKSGIETREVQIAQTSPTSWQIQFFQPPGSLVQEVSIVNDANLGWVVSGTAPGQNGGPPVPMQPITFTPVDMNGSGFNEGVRITQGGYSQVVMRGADGNMYIWNGSTYVNMTSNQTSVGGVNVQVNVTNVIHFPGATAHIGQPTVVDIGGTRIVLNNPPTISTGMRDVSISIYGFNPNQFSVSVGGFSLTPGTSNGRWNNHYDSREELWSRNRLVVMGSDPVTGKPNQWQYDKENLGALLQPERNTMRIAQHAFMGQGFSSSPADWPLNASTAWTAWFNTDAGQAIPYHLQAGNNPVSPHDLSNFTKITRGDGSYYYEITPLALSALQNDKTAYYQTQYGKTQPCPICNGRGGSFVNGQWVICPNCRGEDYDGDGITDIRVYVDDLPNFPAVLQEVASLVPQPHFPDDYYVNAPMFLPTFSGYRNPTTGFQLPGGCWPLVATEDFFKWGVNVGVWKHAFNGGAPNSMNPNDTPMLFPSTREPPWGTVAIASARVGLSTANEGFPLGGLALPNTNGSYLCQFSDKGNRSNWCQASLQNLYYADVRATLAASKNQVNDFDLDEDILQGTPVGMLNGQVIDMGSGLSYLWGAILASNRINRNNWMDRFNGQADPRVGQALSNMRKRNPADDNRFTGPPFDYGSSQLNQVVEH